MISAWAVKLAVTLALIGLALFEAGSPLVTKLQLDGVAAESARQARREFDKSGSESAAKKKAEAIAAEDGATLIAFEVEEDRAAVTIARTAPSFVFGKWDKTKSYYAVEVDGESEGGL